MREQVLCGIALLDEKRPGWQHGIRIDDLDLSSGCSCILGQLFDGSFAEGVQDLFGFSWFGSLPVTDQEYHLVADHGFVTSHDYQQLEMTWKDLLLERRERS